MSDADRLGTGELEKLRRVQGVAVTDVGINV